MQYLKMCLLKLYYDFGSMPESRCNMIFIGMFQALFKPEPFYLKINCLFCSEI